MRSWIAVLIVGAHALALFGIKRCANLIAMTTRKSSRELLSGVRSIPVGNNLEDEQYNDTKTSSAVSCHGLPANHTKPRWIVVPKETAFYLHPGKSGGGSFLYRLQHWWRMKLEKCHPKPCSVTEVYNDMAILGNTNSTPAIAVAIRDPVDRFLSAFYWRAKVLCDTTDPDLCGGTPSEALQNTEQKEKKRRSAEAQTLFDKYNQNANALAEKLCSDNAEAVFAEGERDMRTIIHLKDSIADWLLEPGWMEHPEALVPIVLEPNFGMEQQIDDTMRYIMNRSVLGKAANYSARQTNVHVEDCKDRNENKSKHSSRWNDKWTPLSERGVQCVAQYFRKDYDVIREMAKSSCKTEQCRKALKSILDRRAPLLLDNKADVSPSK